MRHAVLVLILVLVSASARAQEPVGCDKFKWPLDHERALLARPAPVKSGDMIAEPLARAVEIALVPLAAAKLPMPPQRAPKTTQSTAGFLRIATLPKAGSYRVTLSQGAWIDVIQDGRELDSTAFSGALGCSGVRKSVKFDLKAQPFIIQLTGTTAASLGLVVTPD